MENAIKEFVDKYCLSCPYASGIGCLAKQCPYEDKKPTK